MTRTASGSSASCPTIRMWRVVFHAYVLMDNHGPPAEPPSGTPCWPWSAVRLGMSPDF